MMMPSSPSSLSFKEQRARDDLSFDPLPSAEWIFIKDDKIRVSVRYSEQLSKLLGSIQGARWSAGDASWRYPFSSAPAIRQNFEKIDALAKVAKERADTESTKRIGKSSYVPKRIKQQVQGTPRAMTREFLVADPGPYFSLCLEAIGAHPPKHLAPFYSPTPREWVAQIMGVDGRGKFVRAFLSGNRDYTNSNSAGSRGVMTTFNLQNGPIYEVSSPRSWRDTERYFCRIVDGSLVKITDDEVKSCLEK